MKILIVAGLPDFIPNESFDKYIGVDRGSLFLVEKGYQLALAIGDFDSVSKIELEKISVSTDRLIKLPAEKDLTDLEAALDFVLEYFACNCWCFRWTFGPFTDQCLFSNTTKISSPRSQNDLS